MKKQQGDFLFSFFIVLAAFLLFFLLFAPSLNSDDDFFFLYQMAGGHGTKPTHLLHYQYSWHVLLSWPISKLFSIYPVINWYSLTLAALCFTGCLLFTFTLAYLYSRLKALVIFLLFFLFIQSPLLLTLNYSGTSFIATLTGCLVILLIGANTSFSFRKYRTVFIVSGLLIFAGGLLRFHTWALCFGLSVWLAFFVLPRNVWRRFFLSAVLLGIVIGGCHLAQRYYYQARIPDWKGEENIRQAIFALYNKPKRTAIVLNDRLENTRNFIRTLFLFDSPVPVSDIQEYGRRLTRIRDGSETEDRLMLYWLFVNNRAYALMLGGLLILLLQSNRSQKKRYVLLSLFPLLIFAGLFVYMKITQVIFLCLVSFMALPFLFLLPDRLRKNKTWLVAGSMLLLSSLWICVRMVKENGIQKQRLASAIPALHAVSRHQDKLFIEIGNQVPYGDFPVWETPSNFPLPNLIYKEIMLTRTYQPFLERFNATKIGDSLPAYTNVLMTGERQPFLEDHYSSPSGKKVISRTVDSIPYINCFRLQYDSHE